MIGTDVGDFQGRGDAVGVAVRKTRVGRFMIVGVCEAVGEALRTGVHVLGNVGEAVAVCVNVAVLSRMGVSVFVGEGVMQRPF